MVLRWHEWDIAAALRVITTLRAELAASAAAGGAGPMAAAVLDSQQRAITLARDATAARVGTLESYAVQGADCRCGSTGLAQRPETVRSQ
jgi:hypothetical protein